MDDSELKDRIGSIRSKMNIFDDIIHHNFRTGDITVSKKQADAVREVLDLLKGLSWQIALNSYRQLKYDDHPLINKKQCGTPVKIRSCKAEHGDKTYFGILLGDMPLSMSHSIDKKEGTTFYEKVTNSNFRLLGIEEIRVTGRQE